ncbi:YeeE/YedE family protein [Billgrantia sp. Q4P2]|uniref:YeeE/YedE family protein n=1 Tax=Billgrantia sp. Q4P2 TaxID=3463857 RepID=UPI004056E77C
MSHTELVVWTGLAIGLVFGAVGQLSGFCLLRGLSNATTLGDTRKLRAFVLAMGVALLGSQGLAAANLVSLDASLYATPTLSWLAVPLGGLLFGYGMALANGCGARALVLLGGGNLRSFVVLVCLGLAAYMGLSGLLAPLRLWLESGTTLTLPTPDLPRLIGLPGWLLALVVGGGLAAWAFAGRDFRASPRDWLGGLAIGTLVPASWYTTGVLGFDDFEPVRLASLTFVAPIGESLQYLMLSTGTRLGFGVSVVGGVLLGALAMAVARRDFELRAFDSPAHMLRSMAGGALMGTGGVMALGCSIGQGLSGFSTLSLTSFVALAGIVLGARMGIRGPLALSKT